MSDEIAPLAPEAASEWPHINTTQHTKHKSGLRTKLGDIGARLLEAPDVALEVGVAVDEDLAGARLVVLRSPIGRQQSESTLRFSTRTPHSPTRTRARTIHRVTRRECALLEDLHRGALVVELAEGARVAVELEGGAAVLLVVEKDHRGAGADAEGGDLIVAAEVVEVGLGLVELPDVAAELAVLETGRNVSVERSSAMS